MKLIRTAFAAGILAAVSVAACSTGHGPGGTSAGNTNGNGLGSLGGSAGQGTGSVGMHLTIAPGVQFQQLSWTITGTGGPYTGIVTIGDAQSVEFIIPGLPQGTGYTISITGTDSNGDPCSGTATFSITAGATSVAVVTIICTAPSDASTNANVTTGNVYVEAGVTYEAGAAYNCPGISGLSANPAEILPPQTAQLGVQTVRTAGGSTGTPTIQWSTTGGGFDNANSANPVFSCGAFQGIATVTVTIGLTGSNNGLDAGDVCANAANQTGSFQVNCEAGTIVCFTGQTLCPAVGANPAYCAYEQTDTANCGGCGVTCSAPTSACNSGACGCPTAGQQLCGTGAGATCQNTQTDVNHCGNGAACVACPAGDTCNAGVCQAPPPKPCVGTGDAANCVKCTQNSTGICTATEALIVAQDIAAGKNTAGGQLVTNIATTTSCYECLAQNGGLDDTAGPDTGNECGDVTGSATLTGITGTQACINALTCMITKSCDTASPPSLCLCGSAAGSACLTAGAANGPCLQDEINGLDIGTGTVLGSLVEGDPTATQKAYTDKARGAGMANAIGAFAQSNCPSQCGSNF